MSLLYHGAVPRGRQRANQRLAGLRPRGGGSALRRVPAALAKPLEKAGLFRGEQMDVDADHGKDQDNGGEVNIVRDRRAVDGRGRGGKEVVEHVDGDVYPKTARLIVNHGEYHAQDTGKSGLNRVFVPDAEEGGRDQHGLHRRFEELAQAAEDQPPENQLLDDGAAHTGGQEGPEIRTAVYGGHRLVELG
nr:hypothetical protein [Pseudoramibacter alactolyticus]